MARWPASAWIAGGAISLADICLGPIIHRCLDFPIQLPALAGLRAWRGPGGGATGLPEGRRLSPTSAKRICKAVRADDMTKAAVIGLGTMGPGIAATLARGGMTVTAFDTDAEQRAKARRTASAMATGVLTSLGMPDRSGGGEIKIMRRPRRPSTAPTSSSRRCRRSPTSRPRCSSRSTSVVGKNCIIASNTSGIPITKLQAGNSAPGRVVGMHWSNPPHVIPMIEVIAGDEDRARRRSTGCASSIKGLGLLPVVVKKDVPGFVENRILYALLREGVDLVEQGVIDAEGLDTCVSWGIGYKLAVVGPDGAARHGRARHLPGRRQLPE